METGKTVDLLGFCKKQKSFVDVVFFEKKFLFYAGSVGEGKLRCAKDTFVWWQLHRNLF